MRRALRRASARLILGLEGAREAEHLRAGLAEEGRAAADALANLTLTAVLAYLPSVPHWAYHGGAWSWGDTSNNAKWSDNRRVTGHYRVTLTALPVLSQFFMDPDDW